MKNLTLLISIVIGLSCMTSPAMALKEFKKVFEQRYVAVLEKGQQAVFRRAKCNVCHVKGEKRDVNNPYGDALSQRIEGDAHDRLRTAKEAGRRDEELEKLLAEFATALAEVELLTDADGVTYGERLKAGKLPVEGTSETADPPDSNAE